MEPILNYPKNEFVIELDEYIEIGQNLLNRHNDFDIDELKIESLKREYIFWNEEIKEFLKVRFLNPSYENDYLREFNKVELYDFKPLAKALTGININLPKEQLEIFKQNCQKKLDVLVLLKRKLKFINEDILFTEELNQQTMKKIFISHSSLDVKFVEKIIDVLETIGVPSNKIFCSSFEGYGIKLGTDFLEYLRKELDNKVLVIFILSNNFYASPISLCEMGATWVKTNDHIPILIPPFDYKDVKGVIPTTHGMKIDEKERYNSLKEVIESFIELTPINPSVWERKRDNILKDIKRIFETSTIPIESSHVNKNNLQNVDDDYYSNTEFVIKKRSNVEWPDDFEMQVYYIEKQRDAVEKLKQHNPMDIDKKKFELIRKNARKEWPQDFEMQLEKEPVIVYEKKSDIVYIEDKLQYSVDLTLGLCEGNDFYLKLDFKNLDLKNYNLLTELANLPRAIKFNSDLIQKENFNITHIVITEYSANNMLEMSWKCLSDDPNMSLIIE